MPALRWQVETTRKATKGWHGKDERSGLKEPLEVKSWLLF